MEEGQLHYLATLTVPSNVINQYVPYMTLQGLIINYCTRAPDTIQGLQQDSGDVI